MVFSATIASFRSTVELGCVAGLGVCQKASRQPMIEITENQNQYIQPRILTWA